jgi:hypothetical protein
MPRSSQLATRRSEALRASPLALAVDATATRPLDLAAPALVAAAAVAAVVPLWSSLLLPFQDAPQHIAAIRVLADYHTPGTGFASWFQIDLLNLQYLGFYLPAAALAKVFGADVACRIMLSLVALAFPASAWMLLGAFGRDRRLAVFAAPVFHTLPLYMGFFNYVESIPAAIAVLALTERQLRAPTRGRGSSIAVSAALLLWLHPSALAFVLGAAAVLALTSGLPLRRVRRALVALLPGLALFLAWGVHAALARDGVGHAAHTAPRWFPLKVSILDALRFGNVLGGHADELFFLALAALFAVLVLLPGRERAARPWRLPLVAGLALLGYFVAPFDMGYMSWIQHRALPFFALVAIASPVVSRRRAASAVYALAVLLQVAYAAKLSAKYRAFDEEAQVADLRQVLSAADPGKRLLGQIFDQDSHVVRYRPYMHFAAYYEVQRGGRASFNFAETPWTPVRFRPGTEPQVEVGRGWEWFPERLVPSRDAADEDYLLVGSVSPRPDPGPGFVLRARAGRWSLYERRAGR